MPEAPEVHNVLAYLNEQLDGHRIVKAVISHPKLAASESPEQFCHDLEGEHFRRFERLGKYLVLELDDRIWIAHLRMEGKFMVYPSIEEVEKLDPVKDLKHIHALFTLDDGRVLCYKDTRKFGRMYLYPKIENWKELPVFVHVGKDAMDPDLRAAELFEKAKRRSIPVKTFLLDQKAIAGIGNIYADEILFASRIAPQSPANHLSLQDWQAILDNTRRILAEAARKGGTTIRSFSYGTNHGGSFQDELKVHGKGKDEACLHCQEKLVQVRIGGRSTWYCPSCQKVL